ncbi:hypothetical protein PUNSTDRAFT_144852 [Punctularia strigosozonata HHB-11173 SS5]|uniref:uncharacterized protein n=1 Tax=Punctularia strigosozonata (strain HHB-11173) TaxID=741275 RepID=UPI0004417CC3|nr:uncharacterized protein PUNSTDRAFT_144852 [Punctularia strigosozonata HHB-11173 SS5]EIN07352.1 hypothetical protein PUNSTDRAFT_144852 [Punctularia strigosozonata HHB-11173 SS5]
MSLEVARYMTRVNARSPEILAQICYAVLPAFSTFRKQMWPRLLLFFEELLRLMLDILENERWVEKSTSALEKSELDDQEEDNDPAPVAITVQEADDDTENPFLVHNTLSWAPWTPTGKENPTLVSATSPLQSLSVYHISSVVSNVLATALEHLEFTSPDDHTTAQSFYSLFETMMQAKVDIYLDLLSVVAYHSEKARFGSLSLLSRYWPKSLGHTFPLDASHITIEYDVLRHSFVRSHKGLLLTKADLEQRTFEEISVLHAVLWLEMHILDHGTAQSSVAVCRHGTRLDKLDEFELHYCVRLYEAYLGTSRLQISSAVTDYMEENGVNTTDFSMYFDWPLITYITTVIKTPFDRAHLPGGTPPGLLSVNPDQLMDEVESDSSSQPAEMTNLAHLRDALGHVIGLQSEAAARHFLDHLHNLGLITRTDGNPLLFDEDARPFEVQCSFPLPLGLDLSSEVETLFGAVEACLSDLDISMNEAGFLLLLRRLWPNGMATDYALRRLARAVVAWVVAEETRVARIIKEYVSMTATVPGMRSGPVSQQIWPAWSELRVLTTGARPSGNDYSKYRLELRRKYAIPWMLALYNKDPAVYCHTIRELCDELAEESMGVLPSTSGLLFNPLEDVLSDWLHSRPEAALAGDQQPIASLSRLVNRETEISHRRSMTMMLSGDTLLLASFNPWELLKKTALQDADGFLRSVAWLHLFARSGVDIPSGTFLDIVDIGGQHLGLTMTYAMSLVQSALLSAWMKSRGRPELQKLVSVLHTRFYDEISGALRAGPIPSELISFIKHSVAVCLLVYGCERNNVKTRGLVREEEIKHLPSRRNVGNRVSTIAEAIDVDSEFIDALKRYADFGIDEITCIVAQFLDVVLCDTKVAEEVRVGDFVSVESPVLCQCMWKFYAVQHHEISAIRMRLLLRILVADPAPFHLMLQDIYGSGSPWELRIQASTRLFKIIMDLPNPAFSLEDRKWRSSISDIFYYFFSAIWSDEAEEIRTAVDSWSQSLLPAHFEAISRCWDETMEDAPVEERIRLTSFLIQLRSHFPRWQVLSWDVVARCLPGDMDGMENSENNAGVSSDLEDRDSTVCSVSTVVLALGMVANLVPVDINVLKRIKNCLAAVLGFRKPPPVYGELQVIPASSYPCIGELVKVLDAFYPFDVTPSDMGRSGVDEESPSKLLAGSIFIDLVLAIFLELRDLDSLPLTVIKQLLECLLIIIYKHDFDSKSLINLRSVLNRAAKRVLGLVVSDTSYQIRQLALTVCTEFIKRFPLPRYYGLICDMIETAAQVMTSLSLSNDDILAAHARSFLEKALSSFASSGLFSILCERPLDQAFFQVIHNITESHSKSAGVLGGSLRDMLLLDTLRQAQAPERDVHRVQTIMNNLNTFVEVVHHSDYTEDHMRFIASALHAIARRASEGNAQMFNPNSTINMAATLIQYNKVHSRVLLQAVDTVLRAVSLRCNLDTASLRHILQVTDTLYRKANRTNPPTGQNQVAQTILELLSDGLRNKARVNSSSLSSMMEAISDYADMLPTAISSLRADCFFYLASYTSPALHSPADFDTSTSVANWLLKSAEYNPDGLTRMLSENSAERHTSPLSLRAWNILVLAALNSASDDSPALLLGHFTNFSAAYHVALRPFVQFSSTGSKRELTPADINHAYAGIRLWILLARRVFNKRGLVGALPSIFQGVGEDGVAKMIWNELWPPFCTVIASFDEDAEDGMISPATTSAWSTVAELFLFLHQIRSVLALDSSAQATLLNRLRSLGRGEVANNKLGRALSSISEPPPEITLDVAIGQIGRDVAAVEKLHAAESQRKEPAKPQERRKDVRIAS